MSAAPFFPAILTETILAFGATPLLAAVRRGPVAGDQAGDEGAVPEAVLEGSPIIDVRAVLTGDVDAPDHPAGEVGDRLDSGVEDGDGDPFAVDPLGPEVISADHLRVLGGGSVQRRRSGGLDLDRLIGADFDDARLGAQRREGGDRDVGGDAVDDPEVLGDAPAGGLNRGAGGAGVGASDDD